MKVLLPELSDKTDLVDRFFNEARATTTNALSTPLARERRGPGRTSLGYRLRFSVTSCHDTN